METVVWRTFLGTLVLAAAFFARRKPFTKNRHDAICIGVSGAAMGISWLFLFEAYRQIGVSASSLLYYCGPVVVTLLAPFVFGERLTRFDIAAIVSAAAGACAITGGFGSDANVYGVLLGLGAALMYAVMVIFNKKSEHIKGLENSMLQTACAFFVSLTAMLVQGKNPALGGGDVLPVLLLGVVNTGVGCLLYFSSVGRLSAVTVSVCGYIEPLAAVAFAVMMGGESLTVGTAVGALLIVGGAAVCAVSGMAAGKKEVQ